LQGSLNVAIILDEAVIAHSVGSSVLSVRAQVD
jgi:hypothetical protein